MGNVFFNLFSYPNVGSLIVQINYKNEHENIVIEEYYPLTTTNVETIYREEISKML